VSKRLEFIEVNRNGKANLAGYAPYLDYRAAEPEELALIEPLLSEEWLGSDIEETGRDYAINQAVPRHMEEIKRQTVERIDRTITAVKERLTKEINSWDHRANELKQKELAGKTPKLNSAKARQRADDLEARLKKRLEELEQEKQLSPLPPVIVGGAVIIPMGLLERLKGERGEEPGLYAKDTERIERAAVEAVLKRERELGRIPEEQPHNNPGFDILSKDPETGELFFIEVKGRADGADTVTVTRNEILTALNKPEQFILALVKVNNGYTELRYLRKPFSGQEETFFDVTSVNYNLEKLFGKAEEPK